MSTIARSLGMAIAAIIGLIANAAHAETWQEIRPVSHPKTFTIRQDGVTVTVAMPWSGSDEADAEITVVFGKAKPVALGRDSRRVADFGIGVGIVKLNPRDAHPTVLISGFSGGAHCCATLQLVSLVNGKPVIAKLHPRDGDIVHELPADIDGDGTLDIRWGDDSLLYYFTSYAASISVPRIINIRRGHTVDVSREPRFSSVYRKFTAMTLKDCRTGASDTAGMCAGYAYGMAILGKPEEGIRTAAAYAKGVDGKRMAGFESNLRKLMRDNGYLGASPRR